MKGPPTGRWTGQALAQDPRPPGARLPSDLVVPTFVLPHCSRIEDFSLTTGENCCGVDENEDFSSELLGILQLREIFGMLQPCPHSF